MSQTDDGWEEGETRLDRVLETAVERARSLVDAKTVMVLLEDRGLLVVAATTGEFEVERRGVRLQADSSAWRHVMAEGEAERVAPIGGRLGMSLEELGVAAEAALLVPLSYRGRSIGVLAALDHVGDTREFSPEDESLLMGFAASAAMALSAAQSMAEARLRESIDVAERERARWARELHDETLQGLGALRVRLAASLRLDPAEMGAAVATAVKQIEDEIANLRSLITELRPAALDELGLGAAIEGLADNHAATTGMDTRMSLALARDGSAGGERLDRELESGVYRLVQEALTNVAKHAQAETVWIEVARDNASIAIVVRDDGVGFDMDERPTGFGLVGMRERVALAGGSLTIVSTPDVGTVLRGRIPLERPLRGLRRDDAGRG
jgi:signal transduction histidine kinase